MPAHTPLPGAALPGFAMSPPARPKGESLSAQREGGPVSLIPLHESDQDCEPVLTEQDFCRLLQAPWPPATRAILPARRACPD